MTKRYTDDDVTRLVDAANHAHTYLGYEEWGDDSYPMDKYRALGAALAPFLPDPEDALIEKMANEIRGTNLYRPTWENATEEVRETYRGMARTALAVVKREGLPQ